MRLGIMIKKAAALFLASSLFFALPAYSEGETNLSQYNEVGATGGDAFSNGVSLSMLSWGFIIITGITILSIVLHQSTSSQHGSST